MMLTKTIFFGWYHILDKTIYSFGSEKGGIGPKEHSFFITFLFHAINLWTGLRFISGSYFEKGISIYISIILFLMVFSVGYFTFYKQQADNIMNYKNADITIVFRVLVAIVYVAASVYFMFKVGDYVKSKLGN